VNEVPVGPHWPSAAQQRYYDAKRLAQRDQYAEAGKAYCDVADWPDGGDFPERAEALFLCGLMQERARDYPRAVATYRAVGDRFPHTDFEGRANERAAALEQGAGERGLEFQRRLDVAMDTLVPASPTAPPAESPAARGRLEEAVTLLSAILREYRDLPKTMDVALTLGDTHMTLGRYEEARDDYTEGVALAQREASKDGPAAANADTYLKDAEDKLDEAIRAIRRRLIDRVAWALLATVALALLAVRPWREMDGRLLRLGGALVATTMLLGVVAVLTSHVLREQTDEIYPITDLGAALLVIVPGLVGEIVTLGFATRLRRSATGGVGRWALGLVAALGAGAALAAAVCVVYAFELFPYLDSKL
jgi:tetratricopeptide (TPR) repeat protein